MSNLDELRRCKTDEIIWTIDLVEKFNAAFLRLGRTGRSAENIKRLMGVESLPLEMVEEKLHMNALRVDAFNHGRNYAHRELGHVLPQPLDAGDVPQPGHPLTNIFPQGVVKHQPVAINVDQQQMAMSVDQLQMAINVDQLQMAINVNKQQVVFNVNPQQVVFNAMEKETAATTADEILWTRDLDEKFNAAFLRLGRSPENIKRLMGVEPLLHINALRLDAFNRGRNHAHRELGLVLPQPLANIFPQPGPPLANIFPQGRLIAKHQPVVINADQQQPVVINVDQHQLAINLNQQHMPINVNPQQQVVINVNPQQQLVFDD